MPPDAAIAADTALTPVAARAGEPQVVVESVSGECRVRGNFHAPVDPGIVWNVLSDYEHIGDFVSSVRSSHVEWRGPGSLLLRQDAMGSVLLVRRRVQVLLDIHEEPDRRITFQDILHKDFEVYSGAWCLTPDSSGTRVDYELEANPRTRTPDVVCRHILRGTARDLLREVRAEIIRRAPR